MIQHPDLLTRARRLSRALERVGLGAYALPLPGFAAASGVPLRLNGAHGVMTVRYDATGRLVAKLPGLGTVATEDGAQAAAEHTGADPNRVIRMPDQLWDDIKTAADREGISAGEFVRRAAKAALEG